MPSCYGRIRSWHRGMMSRFSNSDSRHGSDKKNINTPAWTRTQFIPLQSVVPLRTNSSNINDMIYLLTAIGLSPGGSSTVHIHTHTQYIQCPVSASFTLAFALQLSQKHGKTSVRVRKTSVGVRKTSARVRKTSE
jgi:hypothetical protein